MNARQVFLGALLVAIVGGGLIAVPWVLCLGPRANARADARTSGEQESSASACPYRYDGKSIEQWQAFSQKELKAERQVEAIRALCAFGTHGQGKEAAATILQIAQNCDRDDATRCEAMQALARLDAEQGKVVKYLVEALTKELDTPRRADVSFVKCSLDYLAKVGPAAKEAAPVVKRISENLNTLQPQALEVLTKVNTDRTVSPALQSVLNRGIEPYEIGGIGGISQFSHLQVKTSRKDEGTKKPEQTPSMDPIVPAVYNTPAPDWRPAQKEQRGEVRPVPKEQRDVEVVRPTTPIRGPSIMVPREFTAPPVLPPSSDRPPLPMEPRDQTLPELPLPPPPPASGSGISLPLPPPQG